MLSWTHSYSSTCLPGPRESRLRADKVVRVFYTTLYRYLPSYKAPSTSCVLQHLLQGHSMSRSRSAGRDSHGTLGAALPGNAVEITQSHRALKVSRSQLLWTENLCFIIRATQKTFKHQNLPAKLTNRTQMSLAHRNLKAQPPRPLRTAGRSRISLQKMGRFSQNQERRGTGERIRKSTGFHTRRRT